MPEGGASQSRIKMRPLSRPAVRRLLISVAALTVILLGWALVWWRMNGGKASETRKALNGGEPNEIRKALNSGEPNEIRELRSQVSAAYAERRTVEPRFTDVANAVYQSPGITLGPEDEFRRPALSNALNTVTQKFNSGRNVTAEWFQIRGRLVLLKNPANWASAEGDFRKAEAMGLNTPSLKIDLGIVYFEHASFTKKRNFSQAIDQFKSVLESKAGSAGAAVGSQEREVALFNLALAYEQSASWDLAVATWKEYPIDRPGPWLEEARKDLAIDTAKIPRAQLYTDPGGFIRHASDPEVMNDIEQYQDIAFDRWLLQAMQAPTSESAQAMRLMATMLAESPHLDPMWQDFLDSTGPADQPAVKVLRDAFIANQNDLHDQALKDANAAARLFEGHNVPGALLAHYQEIYAQQRALNAEDCLDAIDRFWKPVSDSRYHWLQGQLALERAICANLAFSFEKVDPNLEISRKQAADFDYPELQLRTTGMQAGIQRLNFAADDAWATAVSGLNEYWKHSYSPERLLQFYSVMRQIAKDLNCPHAAVVFLQRTSELVKQSAPEDRTLQGLFHMRLVNLYWELGEQALAEDEARHARELLSGFDNPYEALAVIELADFELRSQHPELALTAIQPIGQELKNQDQFVHLDFYRIRGDAERQLQQLAKAQNDYDRGITLIKKSFKQGEAWSREWVGPADKMFRGMVEIRLAQGKSRDALTLWEWSRSLILNRSLKAGGSKTPRLPQTSYPHLVYVSFPDHVHAWLVRGSRMREWSIRISSKDLLKRVNDFNRNCGDRYSSRTELEQQAAELYQLLLQPVIGELSPSETVAVEFDPSIPSFSIEALRSPEGRYFGEDYAISHSPGIFVEKDLRLPEPLKLTAPFLVLDASAEGVRYLPKHELLTAAVKSSYSGTEVMDANTVGPADVDKKLKKTQALLVISHSRQNIDGIALEITPDFYLRAQDFSSTHPENLRIVVLAACSSGLAEKGALASDNLVRSLLVEKVPNVIASRWNVDAESTVYLFQNFYANLARGETAALALRDARRALLEHTDSSHPYFWAAFNLTGRSN